MNLRSLLQSDKLSPEWRYAAQGTLWRILPTKSGRIVGECRDQERKVATFFCLDENTGQALWHNLQLEQPWWNGVETVHDGVVIFHAYAQPDMPAHKGVYAYDLVGGHLLWKNDELTFWFCEGSCVYAYRDTFEKRIGYELELKTGALLRTFGESLEELHALRRRAGDQQGDDGVIVPEPLQDGGDEKTVAAFVAKALKGRTPAAAPEFIRQRDLVAFTFYCSKQGSAAERPRYEISLFVFHLPNARVLFSEIIGTNLTAPVPDTFFIKGDRLFFIKDQRVLVALRLWQS